MLGSELTGGTLACAGYPGDSRCLGTGGFVWRWLRVGWLILQPSRPKQRVAQQELNLTVHAAQLIVRPFANGCQQLWVDTQQE